MSTFEIFLTTTTALTVLLNVFNHWFLSKGKMYWVYILSMIIYVGYIIVETTLAIRHPEQLSVLLYNITNVWAFSMAFKGFLRLKKERGQGINKAGEDAAQSYTRQI